MTLVARLACALLALLATVTLLLLVCDDMIDPSITATAGVVTVRLLMSLKLWEAVEAIIAMLSSFRSVTASTIRFWIALTRLGRAEWMLLFRISCHAGLFCLASALLCFLLLAELAGTAHLL
jgi:hypothetical protein